MKYIIDEKYLKRLLDVFEMDRGYIDNLLDKNWYRYSENTDEYLEKLLDLGLAEPVEEPEGKHIMRPSEYQKLAARTIPENMTKLDMGFHGILGLISEYEEWKEADDELEYFEHNRPKPENYAEEQLVDAEKKRLEEHLKKELGDMWWFTAELCTANDHNLGENDFTPRKEDIIPFQTVTGRIAGVYQKTFQGHQIDSGVMDSMIFDLIGALSWMTNYWDFKISEIWELNIAKLTARYPDGFDAEHSLHRAEGDI